MAVMHSELPHEAIVYKTFSYVVFSSRTRPSYSVALGIVTSCVQGLVFHKHLAQVRIARDFLVRDRVHNIARDLLVRWYLILYESLVACALSRADRFARDCLE